MSDGSVATIVSGIVTICTMLIGFLTIWVKVKYGADKADEAAVKADQAAVKAREVEGKIDHNTEMTSRIEKQTNGALDSKFGVLESKFNQLNDHAVRIHTLEMKVAEIKNGLENLVKTVDSTRHEIRGHLQTITSKMDMMAISPPRTRDKSE